MLVENCLFNPFNDHVNQLKISEHLDASKTVGTQSQREPVKGEQHLDRRPRRLIHHGELCEGKFVSVLQCHPTFHGNEIKFKLPSTLVIVNLWVQGIIVAGYASKIQLEQRQLFRDSSRNTNRHFAIVWKTTQLLEPLVTKIICRSPFYSKKDATDKTISDPSGGSWWCSNSKNQPVFTLCNYCVLPHWHDCGVGYFCPFRNHQRDIDKKINGSYDACGCSSGCNSRKLSLYKQTLALDAFLCRGTVRKLDST